MKNIFPVFLAALCTFHQNLPVAHAESVIPIKEVFEPKGSYPANKFWKVAVIQWNPYRDAPVGIPAEYAERVKQTNRQHMGERIEEAVNNGAKFIVLSEFAVVGYPDIPELPPEEDEFRNREDVAPYVEPVPGPSSAYFSMLAKKFGVWIQFGLAEVAPDDQYFNTAVVINDNGDLVASYRKQTLYQTEHHFLSPGNENVTFETPAGKMGVIICADVYNRSVMDLYRRQKVDVISLSTSWAAMNSGMSNFINGARMTGAYVLAANQTYFPDSGVINPDGSTQSHIRQSGDAIAYGYLPLK